MAAEMFSYQDKRTIVTGAGRGIGREIALCFARLGGDVVLASRSTDELEAVAEEITKLGRRAWVMPTDMSDLNQALALVDKAQEAMGGLDVLVNNAGGASSVKGGVGPLEEAALAGFDAIYQLNVRVPFFTAKRAAKPMIAQRHGAILNIVSVDGVFTAPGAGVYGSAKAALVSLTQTMAVEFGRHNVRVNAIAPSLTDTKLAARHLKTEDDRASQASLFPINRVGTPEDIAGAAVYLCSDEAAWTSGQTLVVAGGLPATKDLFRWVRKYNPVPKGHEI